MGYKKQALELHKKHAGKIEIRSKVSVTSRAELSAAYTPGVAEVSKKIAEDPAAVFDYTSKGNMVAVVSDGSAVLGLGNIGSEAAIPVMEGKALLFKEFAGVDAFPICLSTQDADEIIETVVRIAPMFGGINLEDISAPRCFEIERVLKERLNIPVFHDDQHGTAIVVKAALQNALKVVEKKMKNITVVVNGAGAAGNAIARILSHEEYGVADVVVCDSRGIIGPERDDLDGEKTKLLSITNKEGRRGDLEDALEGAHVFIGVSRGGVLRGEMVRAMSSDPVVLALANPDPEILPLEAKRAGARIVATGRSDFPNQVNNVLAFPGVFRGALDARLPSITEEMKHAAADALALLVPHPQEEEILPDPFDKRVASAVAEAVSSDVR